MTLESERPSVWPTYVINLAADTERMERSAAQFASLGIAFVRIDAVDGRALPQSEIGRVYDTKANRRLGKDPLVASEIGCYLSHIEAWRRIAEGRTEGGFVFEDDFKASRDLDAVMKLLSADRDAWDMAKLFSLRAAPKCVVRRPLGPDHTIAIPYRVPTCLTGYALRRAAARRLLDRAIPFFRPVDEDQKFFWETGLRVALALPPPVTVGNQRTATGTVGADRRNARPASVAGRLARICRGLRYRLRYTALLHYHRARGRGR